MIDTHDIGVRGDVASATVSETKGTFVFGSRVDSPRIPCTPKNIDSGWSELDKIHFKSVLIAQTQISRSKQEHKAHFPLHRRILCWPINNYVSYNGYRSKTEQTREVGPAENRSKEQLGKQQTPVEVPRPVICYPSIVCNVRIRAKVVKR